MKVKELKSELKVKLPVDGSLLYSIRESSSQILLGLHMLASKSNVYLWVKELKSVFGDELDQVPEQEKTQFGGSIGTCLSSIVPLELKVIVIGILPV